MEKEDIVGPEHMLFSFGENCLKASTDKAKQPTGTKI